jgi:hypothetical protein
MNRRLVWGLACAGLALAAPVFAQSPFGFVLHMEDTDASGFGDCTTVDDSALECALIVDSGTQVVTFKKLWIIVYGWESAPGWPAGRGLGGAEVALTFDEQVVFPVGIWTLCNAGLSIPESGWPTTPDTGVRVAWPGDDGYVQTSQFAKVGFVVLQPGSDGRATIAPGSVGVRIASAGGPQGEPPVVVDVPGAGWSSADVAGSNPSDGRRACDEAVPVESSTWGRLKAVYGH